jgi:AP-4 complex subunit mu-1
MISNFFVISPRGDTIIAKDYRSDRGDVGAHERSHTEAFFRKIKFYGGGGDGEDQHPKEREEGKRKANAPPVFIMPDGLSYFHVQRNGLIFGCSTARNVSPTTVVQVGFSLVYENVCAYTYSLLIVFVFLLFAR